MIAGDDEAEEIEYEPPPLTSLQGFRFDLPVPPISLLGSDIQRGKQNLKACLSTSFFKVEPQRFSQIALSVVVFLRRRYSGEAEDSVHTVNDSLFEVKPHILICIFKLYPRLGDIGFSPVEV